MEPPLYFKFIPSLSLSFSLYFTIFFISSPFFSPSDAFYASTVYSPCVYVVEERSVFPRGVVILLATFLFFLFIFLFTLLAKTLQFQDIVLLSVFSKFSASRIHPLPLRVQFYYILSPNLYYGPQPPMEPIYAKDFTLFGWVRLGFSPKDRSRDFYPRRSIGRS